MTNFSGRRPLPAARPWSALTHLSVPDESPNIWATVDIEELAPAAGQSTCAVTGDAPRELARLYRITVAGGTPATVAFPTPIQVHGTLALGPLCIGARIHEGIYDSTVDVDASGYYGM